MLVPEKFHDYTPAEIIIEGPSLVRIEATWNRYQFFRIHNLNKTTAEIRFADGYSVSLQPLQCATVRRTRIRNAETGVISFTNYRRGYNYFFKFEGGDGRHFWHLPKYFNPAAAVNSNVPNFDPSNLQWPATNSMVASNLTNPCIAYEWVRLMNDPTLPASWSRNPHSIAPVTSDSAAMFGNPADNNTLLGDLIHHKGTVKIAKVHRSQKLPAPNQAHALVEFSTFTFRGYATLVTDLSAAGLQVAELPTGELRIQTPADPLWFWDLIPVGTNLFKPHATVDGITSQVLAVSTTPRTLDYALFDQQSTAAPVLASTSPQLVFPKQISLTTNARQALPFYASQTVTYTGDPIRRLVRVAAQASRLELRSLHKTRVGDLLGLRHFGNSALATQDSAYTSFTDRRLVLTPEGLVLKFTESVPIANLPPLTNSYWTDERGEKVSLSEMVNGRLLIKRRIDFRGHGWGYVASAEGYRTANFYPPQYARVFVRDYLNETAGQGGTDFDLEPLDPQETGVQVLTPIRPAALDNYFRTFWKLDGRRPNVQSGRLDGLNAFDTNHTTLAWYAQNRFIFNGAQRLFQTGLLAVPLAADHYNAIAAHINSVEHGRPLHYRALQWVVGNRIISLATDLGEVDWTLPMPVNTWKVVTAGSELYTLCDLIGLPVRTKFDFGQDYLDAADAYNVDQEISLSLTARLQNVRKLAPLPNILYEGDVTGTASATDLGGRIQRNRGLAYTKGKLNSGNAGTVDLRTAYDNFRWITQDDARSTLETYGFQFSHHEMAEPLSLEVLKKGSRLVIMPESREDGTRFGFQFEAHFQTEQDSSFRFEGLRAFTGIRLNTQTRQFVVVENPPTVTKLNRTIQQIVFRIPATAAEARWKRKISDGLSRRANSYPPVTVQRRKDRENWIPEWIIARGEPVAVIESIPEFSLEGMNFNTTWPNIGADLGNPPALMAKAWVLYLEFEAVSAEEAASYEKWIEWELGERTALLSQIKTSFGLVTRTQVYLAPDDLWSSEKDYWHQGEEFLIWCKNAQFDRTPWVFSPATWPARTQEIGSGNVLIAALDPDQPTDASPAGSRFQALYDTDAHTVLLL